MGKIYSKLTANKGNLLHFNAKCTRYLIGDRFVWKLIPMDTAENKGIKIQQCAG